MSAQAQHALLSPSGAKKWLHCTPSARLEEKFPDRAGEVAAEGTLAHAIAELKLTKYFFPMGPQTFARKMNAFKKDPLYQEEMQGHTDAYLDFVIAKAAEYPHLPGAAIERRLTMDKYAPECFGTADCILIGGERLTVIDFKYGKGVPVSAEENPQLMLYALGALEQYAILYDIRQVKVAVVQPRLDSITEYDLPAEELRAWGESIRPLAEAAHKGEGEYCSGEWCESGFCKARQQCRARAQRNLELAKYDFAQPPLLSNEEVGAILKRALDLAKWAAGLQDYALAECLAGREVPGWKAVEGRKGNRAFADTDAAFEKVKAAGYDEAVLYTRKPITLTEVETLLGKKKFGDLLENDITRAPGKPALVPETDNREPYTQNSVEQDFKEEN